MRFIDREQAGSMLAEELRGRVPSDAIVLALPRGGVPVGAVIARAFGLPLDVLVCRKLGTPGEPELGMGAIAEGGAVWVDHGLVAALGVDERTLSRVVDAESAELARRVQLYRGGRPLPSMEGRTVILVDDGVATGGTIRAGIGALRELQAARIVIAAPVIPAATVSVLASQVDDVAVVLTPTRLDGVGAFYEDFQQVPDSVVVDLLARARVRAAQAEASPVRIDAAGANLEGELEVPVGARGLVVFVHGSGSSRRSTRNRGVARNLRTHGFGTLLFDLLTQEEDGDEQRLPPARFDIPLLTRRIVGTIDWVRRRGNLLPIGLFGASTGAAAALMAAALRPSEIRAVVSRGGRPDLAKRFLGAVRAPTLLIVGGADPEVLALNERAFEQVVGEKRLAIVPGATHLFEEPGALAEVAGLAAAWFEEHLAPRAEAPFEPVIY